MVQLSVEKEMSVAEVLMVLNYNLKASLKVHALVSVLISSQLVGHQSHRMHKWPLLHCVSCRLFSSHAKTCRVCLTLWPPSGRYEQ